MRRLAKISLTIAFGLGVIWGAGCSRHPASAPQSMAEAAHVAIPHGFHAGLMSTASEQVPLPHADRGFIGAWGGSLEVNPAQAQHATVTRLPTSYYFGERGGTVYLSTSVYGDAKWPVVKTDVKLLDSRRVRFQLDSSCISCQPPGRQVEVTTLTLTGKNSMRADVDGYTYWQGDGHNNVDYHGELHPLTRAQVEAIDRNIESNHVLLSKIKARSSDGQ
ncbi:MAG: hypothetical protein IVW54_01990 [Candidatus Binataceae bacterium]|nr:hypothetical protein [Candidatus Binataceae bacterium]